MIFSKVRFGIVTLSTVILGFTFNAAAAASVSLVCQNQIGGSWNFGVAPAGCDVSVAADVTTVAKEYKPAVYLEKNAASTARATYMTSMYAALGEIGSYYIHRRNPKVSAAEATAFQQALFALANQESYWTHYRFGTDNVLRYMRGDSLHGFGLMQVDDRSHVAALKQGKGVDLVYNAIYGLDIFYSSWVKSASVSCVSSPSNYRDRTRSAWAAYNGGPGAICRWTRGGSSDVAFASKIDKKAWLAYVKSTSGPSGLDVTCLAEGTRPCSTSAQLASTSKSAPTLSSQTVSSVSDVPVYKLSLNRTYLSLRSCASHSCDHSGGILRSASRVFISEVGSDGWVKVSSVDHSFDGWVLKRNLVVTQ